MIFLKNYLKKKYKELLQTCFKFFYGLIEVASENEIKRSCELINKVDIFNDQYLSKYKIYCLLFENKRDQAQLIYDLLIERGFSDIFFEDKFFFLMDYKSDVNNEISENSILDFHLSHKVTNNFSFALVRPT